MLAVAGLPWCGLLGAKELETAGAAQEIADLYIEGLLRKDADALTELFDVKFVRSILAGGLSIGDYVARLIEQNFGRERMLLSMTHADGKVLRSRDRVAYLMRSRQRFRLPYGLIDQTFVLALRSPDGGSKWGVIDNACAVRGFLKAEHDESQSAIDDFYSKRMS